MAATRLSHIQIGEWIDISARQVPDLPAFVRADGSTTSFAEARTNVHRIASALAERGIGKGDRIAYLAIDSPEYVEVFLAGAKLGAPAVPLNFRLQDSEIELLLATAAPRMLFVSSQYLDLARAITDRLPTPCEVLVLDGDGTGHDGVSSYHDLVDEGLATFGHVDIDDEDLLAISFTSGTTGRPKGVLQSHRMFKQMSSNTAIEYGMRRDELRYSAAPLFHVAGMGLVVSSLLRCQSTLILPQFDPRMVLDWMRKGVTGVFLVPTMVSSLLALPDVDDGGFESMHTLFYGAAPMSPTLLRRAMEVFDCDFYNGFGAGTEAGMQTLLTPEDHRRALEGAPHLLESIGRPGYAIDLRIVDDDMNDVARGEIGEIVTRSDMVMSGYLEDPERTAQAVVDGWFRGGDLAWQDDDGYLYLAGRKNDMIIRGGENVYPVEIESVLMEHPTVYECAVIGAPDDHWGEIVKAFVVAHDGAEIDIDELTAFCRDRLAGYKVPALFRVADSLPKNASQKILKRELRTWP